MLFDQPLIPARLIRRYKRFLADVEMENGEAITVAVPNTGSMMGLNDPGARVWLSRSSNRKRKYEHTLEIVEADDTMVGINTGLPNRLALEAIRMGLVSDLETYPDILREQRYGANSRIDLLLTDGHRPEAYVEVKNVHLRRVPGLAEFPDTVTARGTKHLGELARMTAVGKRAVMIYLVQRSDVDRFSLCRDLDPQYVEAFRIATTAGVEAYAIRCQISTREIRPDRAIPIV